MARILTKKEVENISEQVSKYYDLNIDEVINVISGNVLSEEHIKTNENRILISQKLASEQKLVLDLFYKYSNLYCHSYEGKHCDRYAKLTIGWISYISNFLKDESSENISLKAIIPGTFCMEGINPCSAVPAITMA